MWVYHLATWLFLVQGKATIHDTLGLFRTLQGLLQGWASRDQEPDGEEGRAGKPIAVTLTLPSLFPKPFPQAQYSEPEHSASLPTQ